MILRIFIVALLLSFAGTPVFSQTLSSDDDTLFFVLNDSVTIVGEIITPPSSHPLQSYSFKISKQSQNLSVIPEVFELDSTTGGMLGAPLWSGQAVAINNSYYETYSFEPNIRLDPAKKYVLSVKHAISGQEGRLVVGEADNHSGYMVALMDGGWIHHLNFEMNFSATFAPSAAPVPTVSEWTMILLGVVFAGGAALYLARRTRSV
jgi:hypothetical protein